jgi:hypothetical protein
MDSAMVGRISVVWLALLIVPPRFIVASSASLNTLTFLESRSRFNKIGLEKKMRHKRGKPI